MSEKDAERLRRAIKDNNLFLVKRLLKRIDINTPDSDPRRYTALAWAAICGSEETFLYLLDTPVEDLETSRDAESNTITMLLADTKPPIAASPYELRSDSVDLGAALRMARAYTERNPDVVDWQNNAGKTALHIAAMRGNELFVRMLCEFDADCDLADNEGNTPLHYASAWGHIAVVQVLIDRGCNYLVKNNEGFTASDYAYSTATQQALQIQAQTYLENTKRSRSRKNPSVSQNDEWAGSPSIAVPSASSSRGAIRKLAARMRSGSATSQTTETSDSGDADQRNLPPVYNSISVSSSPRSQPSASASGSVFIAQQATNQTTNGRAPVASTSSIGTLRPNANPAAALSPIAKRMQAQDADAMEKYMNQNRTRSGSSSTADTKSQNGTATLSSAGLSIQADDDPLIIPTRNDSLGPHRTLRVSRSAAQLRTRSPTPAADPTPQEQPRSRSGTNPTMPRPVPIITTSHRLTRSTSHTSDSSPGRPQLDQRNGSLDEEEEPESFTGPPSQYAVFPEPPLDDEYAATTPNIKMPPTDTSSYATPTMSRRKGAFNLLTKPPPVESPRAHRRGSSNNSIR